MMIGIDVSKAKLDCLWLRDITAGKVKTKVFSNDAKGHQALILWSMKNTQTDIENIHFVMEATGVYHEALAYALHNAGSQVTDGTNRAFAMSHSSPCTAALGANKSIF